MFEFDLITYGDANTMTSPPVPTFLASPSDLAAERAIFYDFLPSIVSPSGTTFLPKGYETVGATSGIRPQTLINRLVDECEIFVLVLHKRWGQHAPDAVAVTSYTEEEFTRALDRFNRTGKPTILCFFKNVDIESLADPGPQLSKVLEFRRRLEQSRKILYRTFNSEPEFAEELKRHLVAYADSSISMMGAPRTPIQLPVPEDNALDELRGHDLEMAKNAVLMARSGRVGEAEQLFATLSQTSVTIPALETAQKFFELIENEYAARAVQDRKLALLRDRRIAANAYVAVGASQGLIEGIIKNFLVTVPPEGRAHAESNLRRLFGPHFTALMVEALAENLTLGELRALTRFYSVEAATITGKMGELMGRVIPSLLQKLKEDLPKDQAG